MINIPEMMNNVKKLFVNIDIDPNVAPTVKDPVSPINIFAGYLLYFKKPKQLPIVIQLKKHEYKSLLIKPNIKKPVQLIMEMPAARPSSPSIQFKAFIIPTIQINVKT